MAISTVGIFFLTGIGLWVLHRTLKESEATAKYAEGALKEAQKTTLATFEANDIAKEVALTQSSGMLAAYKARAKLAPNEGGVRFEVEITNIGESPVYGVRYGAKILITENTGEITKPNDFVNTGFGLRPLAPGTKKWAVVIHLGKDVLDAARTAREEGKFIKIWGAVGWSSIFRRRNAYLFAFHTRASLTENKWSKLYLNPWGNTLAPEKELHRY